MTQYPTVAFAALSVVISLAIGRCDAQAQTPRDLSWQQETESRLKAIYERGEFRPRILQADWLPDSSGYTVEEHDRQTDTRIRVRYDVRTSERTEPTPEEGNQAERGPLLSPDGTRVLEFQERNLFVSDPVSGQRIQLTKHSAVQDESYHNPIWSPDGSRVVFVESDATQVRQRPVLVPDDPSYPGIQNHRFARVGEEIEKLRVGVVDSDGQNMQCLPDTTLTLVAEK